MLRTIRKKYINKIFMMLSLLLFVIFLIMYIIRVNETVLIEGNIASNSISFIKSPCNTYIKDMLVKDGDEVKKGQLLGIFDEDSISAYIQDIQNRILDEKEKKLHLEKDNIKTRSRAELDSSSKNYFDSQYAEVIKMIDQKIENYSRQLKAVGELFTAGSGAHGKAGIVAPCDGIIEFVRLPIAQESKLAVNPYDTPTQMSDLIGRRFEKDEVVLRIIDTNNVYIDCLIRESDFPYIYEKDRTAITLKAYPYEKYGVLEGFIDKLYGDPVTKNGETLYKCEIRFTGVNREIKPYIGLKAYSRAILKRDISLIEYLIDTTFKK